MAAREPIARQDTDLQGMKDSLESLDSLFAEVQRFCECGPQDGR